MNLLVGRLAKAPKRRIGEWGAFSERIRTPASSKHVVTTSRDLNLVK